MSWVRKSVGPRESDTNTGRRRHEAILLPMSDIAELTERIRVFSEERDWTRFHDPKSLSLALVGEVGELAELLQWLPADEATALLSANPLRQRVAEELSDVLIYLLRLADVVNIDLAVAADAKLNDSGRRFPVGEVYGKAPERR